MTAIERWSAWLRVSAASIALFALVGIGHVLPAFHFALVAHRVCAEHGELVHEAAPSADSPAPSDVPALVAGADARHEHEHCGVLALPGSFGVPASAPRAFEVPPREQLEPEPGCERPAHVDIALLAYAPKLAPPARG